ncbi:hypothetical protein Trydic_g14475 [Trypoxylus dichotomus]
MYVRSRKSLTSVLREDEEDGDDNIGEKDFLKRAMRDVLTYRASLRTPRGVGSPAYRREFCSSSILEVDDPNCTVTSDASFQLSPWCSASCVYHHGQVYAASWLVSERLSR